VDTGERRTVNPPLGAIERHPARFPVRQSSGRVPCRGNAKQQASSLWKLNGTAAVPNPTDLLRAAGAGTQSRARLRCPRRERLFAGIPARTDGHPAAAADGLSALRREDVSYHATL